MMSPTEPVPFADAFNAFHRHDVLEKYGPKLKVGSLEGAKPIGNMKFADISKVPFAEAPFWRGMHSNYHNESHVAFRKAIREFVSSELREVAEECEESGKYPTPEIYAKMGKFGLLACRLAHGPHLKWVTGGLPGGVPVDKFDYFHESIAHEEVARLSTPGFIDGLGAGYVIGCAPVLVFGSPAMAATVGKSVVMGEKRICLAISEPAAGSDVAGILTHARKEDGHYIVNGTKKWITNGCFADYFVTAVRTGGKGMGGISLMLIERDDGVETKAIKTSYAPAAGTAYVMFEDVKVPENRLLGKENQGFACIMYNFNHERWFIVCQVVSGARYILEECFKWASQRMVFGKPLMTQPVIRATLAKMSADLEATTAWLESITFQMQSMNYAEQQKKLAGPIALLKYQSTRMAHDISDDACQIFGGRAITKTGMGKYVERFQRTYKFGAILGGSEEIMADLGIKQSLRDMPKDAKL